MDHNTDIARKLAPEDIREGMCVTVLYWISEFAPPIVRCEEGQWRSREPIRVRWLPSDPFPPMKVKAVCLPHVFVRLPGGEMRTLDVRECEFATVSESYARCVFEAARGKRKKRSKEKHR
ncbi:MAG: hypothetical protein SYC29_14440 [Planctomycetota bacterium]|nr:hypothetical protein [Planctomycetota bacterium]